MLVAVLTGLVDDERRSAVHKFVMLFSSGTSRTGAAEAARTQCVESFQYLSKRPASSREIGILKGQLSVEAAADRRYTTVARIIGMQAVGLQPSQQLKSVLRRAGIP